MEKNQGTLCGKMCLEHSQAIKERNSELFLKDLLKSKKNHYLSLNLKTINGQRQDVYWEMTSPFVGECLMLNTSELPNEEKESSLSQILMEQVPEKYYLSQKACMGILNRAKVRGKQLPEILQIALEKQAKI